MSSDSNSSSGEERIRKRKHKKQVKVKVLKKSKKHKLEKRHKEKKHRKLDKSLDQEPFRNHDSAPTPTQFVGLTDEADAYMPALPPHLIKSKEPMEAPLPGLIIGPIMPVHLAKKTTDVDNDDDEEVEEEDDLVGTFGPIPNATQVKLEERALALKLAALEGRGLRDSTANQDVREEWMLELPEVGLKGGLAALNNMKRTFYQGKERPDFSDRSAWTKTPQTAAASPKPCSSKDLVQRAQADYVQQRDEEQELLAKKHEKKHKSNESLVNIHQKKLRKEQREREQKLAASGAKPERRPFSRDIDLKLNKIDKNQTKQIVDKAKILNTKFSSGQSKYL